MFAQSASPLWEGVPLSRPAPLAKRWPSLPATAGLPAVAARGGERRPPKFPAWPASACMGLRTSLLDVDGELGDAGRLGEIEHVHDVAVLHFLVGAHDQTEVGVAVRGRLELVGQLLILNGNIVEL